MTNTLIYICISFKSSGQIEDVELLDGPPEQSFLDGYDELGVRYEIRAGYLNGGDSSLELRG